MMPFPLNVTCGGQEFKEIIKQEIIDKREVNETIKQEIVGDQVFNGIIKEETIEDLKNDNQLFKIGYEFNLLIS